MKPIIQKLWMFVAMLYVSITAYAYDFEVADIQYDIVDLHSLTVKVVGCNEQLEGSLIIPSTVNLSNHDLTVVEIAPEAFKGNVRITSLIIGDNVINIGKEAFYGCIYLNSVDIPDSVKKIGPFAFESCHSLSKVNIADLRSWCLIDFKYYVFSSNLTLCIENSPISVINIPNGISEIKPYAFDSFTTITGVTFPKTIKKIGDNAFRYCNIGSLSLPENLDSIMSGAFSRTSITELNIPKSVRYIGELDGLPKLKKMSFEDSEIPIEIEFESSRGYGDNISGFVYGSDIEELYIGRPITMNCGESLLNGVPISNSYFSSLMCSAFHGLKSLKKVVIGANCNRITPQWFHGCSNLKQVVIQDGSNPIEFFQNINYRAENDYDSNKFKYVETFADCPLEDIYIGRNIIYTQIHNGVSYPNKRLSPFENKKTINKVVIGNEVTNLPASNFFKDDNIQSLEIGQLLSYIPDNSFAGNNEISSITIRAEVPPEYSTSFPNSVYINTKLYVPIAALSAYQSAEPWKNFWNISDIENMDAGIPLLCNNETDCRITVGHDGLVYVGTSMEHISIYGIDGKQHYSGDVEPNQYISLDKGIYIVKLNNNSVKIKI